MLLLSIDLHGVRQVRKVCRSPSLLCVAYRELAGPEEPSTEELQVQNCVHEVG